MAACTIRAYQDDDSRQLWEAVRESVGEAGRWLPWCHPEYSMADAAEWIRTRGPLAAEGREYSFAIVGVDGRFLGGCGVNQINRDHRFGNLGYWVRTSATRRGVATEAVRQLAAAVFGTTDLVRLEIVCAVGNEPSQRVALRAGAVREGVARSRLLLHGEPVDAVMYSLVRETGDSSGENLATEEELNIRVARRVWDEVWHEGDFGVVDELFDPQFVRHDLDPARGQGREQNAAFIRRMREAFPDLHFTVDDVIARDDKVVTRYHFEGTHLGNALGFEATGKRVGYTGTLIQRFRNGRIAEQWTEANLLGLFRQLGLVPPHRQ